MSDLVIHTHDLPDLSVAQLAKLPSARLQELDLMLTELQTWLKSSRDRMHAALEQRYGEQGRSALLSSGRDFGVTHLTDGDLDITYELPKRVAWNQKLLAEIAERIVQSGERVQDYMDVELSVSETRFNNWPATLKEQFTAARTVKPGKTSYRLVRIDSKGRNA